MTTLRVPEQLDLEQTFSELAEQWRQETAIYSSVSKKAMHPAYQRIIGMGPAAIPPQGFVNRQWRERQAAAAHPPCGFFCEQTKCHSSLVLLTARHAAGQKGIAPNRQLAGQGGSLPLSCRRSISNHSGTSCAAH